MTPPAGTSVSRTCSSRALPALLGPADRDGRLQGAAHPHALRQGRFAVEKRMYAVRYSVDGPPLILTLSPPPLGSARVSARVTARVSAAPAHTSH